MGKLTPMNEINWLQCPLVSGGVWPMVGTMRMGGKEKNQGRFISPQFYPFQVTYWLAVVSPSKNKAPVRHFFQSVSHPCPSGLVVVRDSSLWSTAIALVFLKQRSSKHSSETPRGPAPLSGTV